MSIYIITFNFIWKVKMKLEQNTKKSFISPTFQIGWKCGVKLLKFSEWDKSCHGVVTIPSSQALLELLH